MWRTFGGSFKPRLGLFALKKWSVYCEYDAFSLFKGCFILLPFLGTAETKHFPISQLYRPLHKSTQGSRADQLVHTEYALLAVIS